MPKVILINGSPRAMGNTRMALREMERYLQSEGIETQCIQIGNLNIRGCAVCGKCSELGHCVVDDEVNQVAELLRDADGLVIGTPVYYASPNGTLISFLDRLFYSASFDKSMKVGAAVAVARRGGCTAALEVLNKYFIISGMPIAPSQYWPMAHGNEMGEAVFDEEGMQTMRRMAVNMAFLIKSIALGKAQLGAPTLDEPRLWTNFISK